MKILHFAALAGFLSASAITAFAAPRWNDIQQCVLECTANQTGGGGNDRDSANARQDAMQFCKPECERQHEDANE